MRLADAISLRSRRRKLALFLEVMRPTPATTVLDVGVDEVSARRRRRAERLHDAQPPRGALPVARAAHGARSARRRPLSGAVPADRVRPGRRLRAALRGRCVRRRVLERGDRARRRARAAGGVRPRGAPRRPSRLRHDAEPLVSDRGAHEAAARPLAAGGARGSRLRPRGEVVGAGEPPARPVRLSGRSSPARSRSAISA